MESVNKNDKNIYLNMTRFLHINGVLQWQPILTFHGPIYPNI